MTYEEIAKLVKENNRSKLFSDEFVICLIWKETNFDETVRNKKSTATGLMQLTRSAVEMVNKLTTGLMQLTRSAVEMVNKLTPGGVHFEHSDMTDAAKNIQCGTYYLDIAKTKLSGIDTAYGTGAGYSKSIVSCEKCLKSDREHPMTALLKIHQ